MSVVATIASHAVSGLRDWDGVTVLPPTQEEDLNDASTSSESTSSESTSTVVSVIENALEAPLDKINKIEKARANVYVLRSAYSTEEVGTSHVTQQSPWSKLAVFINKFSALVMKENSENVCSEKLQTFAKRITTVAQHINLSDEMIRNTARQLSQETADNLPKSCDDLTTLLASIEYAVYQDWELFLPANVRTGLYQFRHDPVRKVNQIYTAVQATAKSPFSKTF